MFDILLFYLFLCNVCIIIEYVNKWGNDLNLSDRCFLVNIERMCMIRNEFGYYFEFFILDLEFEKKWKNIF